MLRRNVTFNKHIYKPYETVLFMALLKALCWALIFILRINYRDFCLIISRIEPYYKTPLFAQMHATNLEKFVNFGKFHADYI